MNSKAVVAIGMVLGCVGVAFLLLLLGNTSGAREVPVYEGPVTEVLAEDLGQRYRVQPEQAHATYTGKGVLVGGLVVRKRAVAHKGIEYQALDLDGGVVCLFPSTHADRLKAVREAKGVEVRGKCEGVDRSGQKNVVLLVGCQVTDIED